MTPQRPPAPTPPGPQLPGMPRWLLVIVIAYLLCLPPVGMALLLQTGFAQSWHPELLHGLTAYVTMLLSLYGGLHWGLGLRYLATTAHTPAFHFLWGPIPALLAWLAGMQEPGLGLTLHMVMLLLTYWVDHHTYPGAGLGPWLGLRLRVTVLTAFSCLLGLLHTLLK